MSPCTRIIPLPIDCKTQSTIEYHVQGQVITEVHPGGGKNGRDTKVLHSVLCSRELGTVSHPLPRVPPVLDGTVNKKPPLTPGFLTV